jgi:hypothetical protein
MNTLSIPPPLSEAEKFQRTKQGEETKKMYRLTSCSDSLADRRMDASYCVMDNVVNYYIVFFLVHF